MSQSYFPINKKMIKSSIFWEELEKNNLKTTKCENNHTHWPPRTICPICYSNNLEWTDLPLTGTLIGWTEVFAPPEGFPKNYIVGIIEIKPDNIKIFGRIEHTKKELLKIGCKINIEFEKDSEEKYFYFRISN
ncbi:MAG: Zn-ribbon domain-containing OB-fold protein [Candidatus Hodarchaeales archaeon]